MHQGHRTKCIVPEGFEPGVGAAIEAYTSSPFPARSFTLRRPSVGRSSTMIRLLSKPPLVLGGFDQIPRSFESHVSYYPQPCYGLQSLLAE